MLWQSFAKPLGIIVLVVAMLAGTMATVAAAPLQQAGEQDGIFGVVIAVDGDVLTLQTKQGEVQIKVTADTQFRAEEEGQDSLDAIRPGDRIGALVVSEDGLLVAQIIMIIPQQGSVVHL
ncbi:MAG: hypothetical protein V3U26_05500, partial [Dehalococcoidia bacterium]